MRVMAIWVLPAPVAIWTSDREKCWSFRLFSTPRTASTWAWRNPVTSKVGSLWIPLRACGVLRGLPLHLPQRSALGLGLDHPEEFSPMTEGVVRASMIAIHHQLANDHTFSGRQFGAVSVLDHPPASRSWASMSIARARCSGFSAARSSSWSTQTERSG